MGASAARNQGLELSRGRFIGDADSDDAIEKDMYELLVGNAVNTGSDISVCGIMRVHGNHVRNRTNESSISVYDNDEGLYEVLTGLLDMSANNKIFRSEIAAGVKFEGRFKEDLLYNVRTFLKARKVVFQNSSKYIYKIRENSVSARKFSIRDMEGLLIDRQIIDLVSGQNEKIVQEARKNFFIQNLSTINLILMFSEIPYPDDYRIITDSLNEYSFLASGKILKVKHRAAYKLFSFSPALYRFLLKLYVAVVPSEVGIRDK
jgi:glycosyltransferase involved in cell wall biosynthesis